jgi:hypothetical protein
MNKKMPGESLIGILDSITHRTLLTFQEIHRGSFPSKVPYHDSWSIQFLGSPVRHIQHPCSNLVHPPVPSSGPTPAFSLSHPILMHDYCEDTGVGTSIYSYVLGGIYRTSRAYAAMTEESRGQRAILLMQYTHTHQRLQLEPKGPAKVPSESQANSLVQCGRRKIHPWVQKDFQTVLWVGITVVDRRLRK